MKKLDSDRRLGAVFALGPGLFILTMIVIINSHFYNLNFKTGGTLFAYAAGIAGFCILLSLPLIFRKRWAYAPAMVLEIILLIGLAVLIPRLTSAAPVNFRSPIAMGYLGILLLAFLLILLGGRELTLRLMTVSAFTIFYLMTKILLHLTRIDLHNIRNNPHLTFYSHPISGALVADFILVSALVFVVWGLAVLYLTIARAQPRGEEPADF